MSALESTSGSPLDDLDAVEQEIALSPRQTLGVPDAATIVRTMSASVEETRSVSFVGLEADSGEAVDQPAQKTINSPRVGPRSAQELWGVVRINIRAYINASNLLQDVKSFRGEDDIGKLRSIHSDLQRLSAVDSKHDGPSCCLFMPDDTFRVLWDIAQTVSLIWVAITIPFFATFGIEFTTREFLFWWDVGIDLYFVVDVVIQFRTAYWDDRGFLVTDLVKIRNSYIRGWFILDFVSCLPVGYVSMIFAGPEEDGTDLRAIKILRLLRLAKLLRLQRLRRLLDRYADAIQEVAQAAQAIFVPIIVILYISHVLACLNYIAGSHVEFQEKPFPGRAILGWAACAEHDPDEFGNTKTCKSGVDNDGSADAIVTLYLMAFHAVSPKLFSLMDYHQPPFSNGMLLFAIVAEFICTIVFGWLTSSLNTYLSTGKLAKQQYQHRMETLSEFMRVKGVPFIVRRKIRMFYENFYKHKSVFDETEILKHLPPDMASELVYCMYRGIISNCPLFRDLSEELVTKICVMLHPYATSAGDVIIREGTASTDLYLLILGKVLITSQSVAVCVLKDGSFFGEMGLLAAANGDENVLRTKTATAVSNCELTFLPRVAALKLLESHDEFRERLMHFSISRKHRDLVRSGGAPATKTDTDGQERRELLGKMVGMSVATQRDILEDPFTAESDAVAGYKTHELFQASKLATAASKLRYARNRKDREITEEQFRFVDESRRGSDEKEQDNAKEQADKHAYKSAVAKFKSIRAKRALIHRLGIDSASDGQDNAAVAVAEALGDLSSRIDTAMSGVRKEFEDQVKSINTRFDKHAANQAEMLSKLSSLLNERRGDN